MFCDYALPCMYKATLNRSRMEISRCFSCQVINYTSFYAFCQSGSTLRAYTNGAMQDSHLPVLKYMALIIHVLYLSSNSW